MHPVMVLRRWAVAPTAAVVLAVLIAASWPSDPSVAESLRGAVVTPSTLSNLGTLDPEKVQEFVVQLDGLLDRLERPEASPSNDDMLAWAYEILPYFEYERVRNGVVVPNAIRMTPYLAGMEHNHILGRAYCVAPEDIPLDAAERPYPFDIEINMRLGNPHSSWFADPSYLSTLIHEMTHVQGACGHGAADEHTAQIVTVEILSALVLGGNKEALYPLLDEIRGWGMSYLLYDAINLNDGSKEKLAAYIVFRDLIYDNAFETARSEKSLRFWEDGRSELATILHTYSVTPLVRLVEGIESKTVPLVIPLFEEYQRGFDADADPYRGHRDFDIDDFAAFVESAEALVAQAERDERDAARKPLTITATKERS